MNTSLESEKLSAMELIKAIDSKLMLDNVLKYLRELMKTSDNDKLSVDTMQMIERSRKEYAEGKTISFDSAADAQKWMDSL